MESPAFSNQIICSTVNPACSPAKASVQILRRSDGFTIFHPHSGVKIAKMDLQVCDSHHIQGPYLLGLIEKKPNFPCPAWVLVERPDTLNHDFAVHDDALGGIKEEWRRRARNGVASACGFLSLWGKRIRARLHAFRVADTNACRKYVRHWRGSTV
jgi:hypothetical protein